LNGHLTATMRSNIDAHPDWLTVERLPGYAHNLNPIDGAWANMKNGLGNLAATRGLIDGFLTSTGLSLEPEPP
jgi:transposase